MTSRQQRVLRGAAWASVATLLAATSHTVAGGPAPSLLLVAAMAVLLTPVTAAVAGPRPGLGRLTLAVAAAQVTFHAVFDLLGAPTGQGAVTSGTGPHAHHGASALLHAVAVGGGTHPEGWGMILAHAVAGLITVALLWRGERVVRAIAAGTDALLRRVAVPRVPVAVRPPRPVPAPPRCAPASALLSAVSRRGPPVALGA